MPNTLFKYTERIGMVERPIGDVQDPESWSTSKDLALITYYLCELAIVYDEIEKAKKLLSEKNKTLTKLEKKYGYLRQKYPEEFI